MNEPANGALSLDEVSRRFADSEQALDQARQNLERLAKAEQLATAASGQLKETAQLVGEYARAAGQLVGELAETQRQAREVLEAGVRLLDGSELRELSEGIAALRRGQEELGRRVGDVDAAEARAQNAEQIIAHIKANVPGRTLKKLGLDG
jgi:hypothetical protein